MLSKIKEIIIFICAAVFILNGCAYAFESGFSDDFFNVLKKKEQPTEEMKRAKEELKKKKNPCKC